MSERYRTKRLCSKCGNIYMGRPDSSMCSECTEESRIQNVVRERTCIDCGCKFKGGPRARRCPQCREIAKKKIQNIAKVLPYDHWEVWIPVSCAVNNILWWADDKNIALTVNMMLYLHGKGHTKLVTTSVQMSFRLRKSVGMKGRRYAYIAYVHFGIVQQATCAQTIAVSNNLECNNT